MKKLITIGNCLVLALAISLAGAFPAALAAAIPENPVIEEIRLQGEEITVVAAVPAGIRKVTLESRSSFAPGGWQPRAVARLNGGGGTVTFRLARAAAHEFMRVRADATEPLPGFFYQGTNVYGGVTVAVSENENAPALPNPGGVNLLSPGVGPESRFAGDVAATREVVESDIWKIQGDRLYFFNQNRGLQVIDITRPDLPMLLGTYDLPAAGEQMYLLGDTHVALLARDGCGSWSGQGAESRVIVLSVSSGVPREVASLPVRGQIQESRLVGTALYVASLTYEPTPENSGVWQAGTVVSAFDLSQPEQPVVRPSIWAPGNGNVIAATDRFLFVATPESIQEWWNGSQRTVVQAAVRIFDISAPDGTVRALGTVNPRGYVKDKFKMHLEGSVFTVVSERWLTRLTTFVETFSLADPARPEKLGELKVIENETLFATRFDGDRLYVVTFQRVDPLWVIDLSLPAQPRIVGELEIPGWSTYIQPLGDRLVTVGIDNANGWRVAVSLFDVADPARPRLASKAFVGEGYSSSSEANWDEKALSILPEQGLILVPFTSYGASLPGPTHGVQLIDLGRDTLVKRGVIEQDTPPRRATAHRDRLLSVSARELVTVDATDRDRPAITARTELSWKVDRVLVAGTHLIELDSTTTYGGYFPVLRFGTPAQQTATARVVSQQAPERVLTMLALTNQTILGATIRSNRLWVLQGKSAEFAWWDGTTNLTTPIFSPASLTLTVLDTANLPQLSVLGREEAVLGTNYWGTFEALWPRPGVLVWASEAGGGYWPWAYDLGLRLDFAGPGVRVGSLAPVSFYYYGGGRVLVAFDAAGEQPRFASHLDLNSSNQASSFSRSFLGGDLIFQSHDEYELQTNGFRTVTYTNKTWTTVTNFVPVTNVVRIPHYRTETNYSTVTNYARFTVNSWFSNPAGGVAGPVQFATAGSHNLAVLGDGTWASWGANWSGQLGAGNYDPQAHPQFPSTPREVTAIAAGLIHSLALTRDGTVWAWGNDGFGQLGNGIDPPQVPPLPEFGSPAPIAISSLNDIRTIAAGYYQSFAIKSDGTVWAWGGNWNGQLGDGTREDQRSPVPIPAVSGAKTLGGGTWHSLALLADGTVSSWGGNRFGQLGDGTTNDRLAPSPVAGLSGIQAIATGEEHNLALGTDGSVSSWGRNNTGQLGDGTGANRSRPERVPGLPRIRAVAAGAYHSLALGEEGTVWAWGRNEFGQLGDGTFRTREQPEPVLGLEEITGISAGDGHSLALRTDGTVWAWGNGTQRQLGDGTEVPVPRIDSVTNVNSVVEYTFETNVTLRAVYSSELREVIVTNTYPIRAWLQHHFLDVVDFSSPVNPLVRTPVKMPGVLEGLSHGGALLYTTAGRSTTNGTGKFQQYLEASAYDGVAAYLVDSMALSDSDYWGNRPPLVVTDTNIFLARAIAGTNASYRLERWTLAEATGTFVSLGALDSAGFAHQVRAVGDLHALYGSDGLTVFTAGGPAGIVILGKEPLGACFGFELSRADGRLDKGLWLPVGEYGIIKIGLNPAGEGAEGP